MKFPATAFAVLASSVVLAACGKDWPEDEKPEYEKEIVIPGEAQANAAEKAVEQKPKSPADEAKEIFKTRCAACHGQEGKGDGPGAAAVNPKPRNFTDATWQGKVDDDHIAKTILLGGAAVGKSPVMPANPDLKGKDAVLKELVGIIRGFKG